MVRRRGSGRHALGQWRPERTRTNKAMIYLIVGLDRHTLAPWHENIRAGDVATATRIACARAQALGINLVVAAVIGANSSIVSDPVGVRASSSHAA
jgi:hypothetical protein